MKRNTLPNASWEEKGEDPQKSSGCFSSALSGYEEKAF